MNSIPRSRSVSTLLALFAAAPLFATNETIKSTTTPLPTDRLLMTTGSNWVDNSAPLAGDDLFFNDIGTGNRLVVHNSAAATVFTFNSLNFTQTSAFINRLDVRAPMTVSNAITLAAADGGQTVLRVDTANVGNSGTPSLGTYAAQTNSANTALTVSSIAVNDNASLIFARNLVSTASGLPTYVSGDITVNEGGSLVVNRAFRPAPTTGTNTNASTSLTYRVGGSLSLAPGATLSIAPNDVDIPDANSGVGTELPDTRLQINGNFTATGGSIISGNSGTGDLGLVGATNSIAAGTNLNTTDLLLTSTDTPQSLNSGATLNGLGLVAGGNSVKTVTATAQVGNITFRQNTAASVLTLKLGADLQLKSGASMSVGSLGAAGTLTQEFVIDTSGFALDGSAGSISINNSNASRAAAWTFTGGGSVSADTLSFNANGNTVAPDLVVAAGTSVTAATFDATGAGTISLSVNGLADFASISAPIQTFAGALVVNFGAAPLAGSYQLFGANGGGGDFTSVAITGLDSATLAGTNVWTGSSAGFTYEFSELNGALTVSAIPEPAAFASLAGLVGLALASSRRRRN